MVHRPYTSSQHSPAVAVGLHDVDIEPSRPEMDEGDVAAIGWPAGRNLGDVSRQEPMPASTDLHDVKLLPRMRRSHAAREGCHRDALPVGRPGWNSVRGPARHHPLPAAVGVHDIDVERVADTEDAEHHPPPVGRPDGTTAHVVQRLPPWRCSLDEIE